MKTNPGSLYSVTLNPEGPEKILRFFRIGHLDDHVANIPGEMGFTASFGTTKGTVIPSGANTPRLSEPGREPSSGSWTIR